MTDKSIGRLVITLNKAIKDGVKLFNDYKELSKDFQEQQKILMTQNNKEAANELKKNFDEKMQHILGARKGIEKLAKTLPEHVRQRQYNKTLVNEETLKKTFSNKLEKHKQEYRKISELYLVNTEKKFLKEKQKINVKKEKILSSILKIGKEIRSYMKIEDFKDFIKRMYKSKYDVLDGKTISFKTLMHHLESGQVSENVAKTTKQIDKLMTIGNVINRKKNMETGILKKEIEKLLKDYDKTMISLKKIASTKFPNKNITNEDIESLLQTKYSKENSIEIKETINKLATDLRILNSKIKIKMQELKKLQES